MSAKTIMQLASRVVKGNHVTIPALSGREFAFFLDSLRELRDVTKG